MLSLIVLSWLLERTLKDRGLLKTEYIVVGKDSLQLLKVDQVADALRDGRELVIAEGPKERALLFDCKVE